MMRTMHLVRRLRAALYDAAIVPMTAAWYTAVLERLPDDCRLLDIGIGTGAALVENGPLLLARRIRVTGVDIDAAYIERCCTLVESRGLSGHVDAKLESIYDHGGGPYDAAYFSGSFMLLPDPVAALRHVAGLLTPESCVYFTQTFEHSRSRIVERIKPALRFVTSIDFGGVTYEPDFLEALCAAGLGISERYILHAGRARSSVLVVASVSARGALRLGPDRSLKEQPAERPDVSLEDDFVHDDEAFVVPIEDALDLHTFLPRDIPAAVEGYLEAAIEAGFREVRLIHGRGTGFQRNRVREILSTHSGVASFADAPPERGGWGATVVHLKG
jgi:SAM-dependent methyltransferase